MGHNKRGGLLVGLFWLDFHRVLVSSRQRSPWLTDADSTVAVTAAPPTVSAAPAAPSASSLTRGSAAVPLVRGVAFVHR